jgi:tetratricopeptide (TPR) repeat protein
VKRWIGTWILACAAIVGWIACTGDAGEKANTTHPEPTDVIDQELMIALAQAKNFHHKAKVYMSDGKPLDAIASVRQILSLRFPAGAPEADDVRLDARALLAKYLLAQNQVDEAMRTVEEGLAQTSRKSFFVANLHTVKGEIHEARAEQAVRDGNKPRADAERHAAIDEYDRSIQINKVLQEKLLMERQ